MNPVIEPAHDLAVKPTLQWKVPYEQGPEGGNTSFAIRCTNVPNGSAVAMTADTPGPQPPIFLPPTTVQNPPPDMMIGITCAVEADYETTITAAWYARGHAPTPGMKLELVVYMAVPPGTPGGLDPMALGSTSAAGEAPGSRYRFLEEVALYP